MLNFHVCTHTYTYKSRGLAAIKYGALFALLSSVFGTGALTEDQAHQPSTTLQGFVGLNTVPSARFDTPGTVRAQISTLDPYLHSVLGFQISEPLYISLRQSAEVSDLNDDADRLYPGLDLKLRLMKETHYRPALAVGLQSATGHKRMAGEYVALTKKYNAFDFTAGLGWGRFGTAGHINNPLKGLFDHFGKERHLDGEMPNEPTNWFTGEDVGFFGGVEYFIPYNGLSIKADIGADRYSAEHTKHLRHGA